MNKMLQGLVYLNGLAWIVLGVWVACQPKSTCHIVTVADGIGTWALVTQIVCAVGMLVAVIWEATDE